MTTETQSLPCMGSKREFAAIQLQILEECPGVKTLVDVCGGGATIALSADKSHFHTVQYNDLDTSRTNLVRALQSKELLELAIQKVKALVAQYENPKELYDLACSKSLNTDADIITSAAYAIIWSSCSKNSSKSDFKGEKDYERLLVSGKAFATLNDLIPAAQGLTVTNIDLFDFLAQNKENESVLAYIDPPYIYTSAYGLPFGVDAHKRLIDAVVESKMKIAVCLQTSSADWGELDKDDALKSTSEHGGFKKKAYFSTPDEEPYIQLRRVPGWHLYGCGRRVAPYYYFDGNRIPQDIEYPEVSFEELMFTNFEAPSFSGKEWTKLSPL